jgi:hypothetical protein
MHTIGHVLASFVLSAVAVVTAAAPGAAQAAPTATFSLIANATSPGGATSRMSSSAVRTARVGETVTLGAWSHRFSNLGTGSWPDVAGDHHDNKWRVGIRLLAIQEDRARFEVEWARHEGTGASARQTRGETIGVVTLRKGQRRVLDLAHSSVADSEVASVLIELELTDLADPAFSTVWVDYEVRLFLKAAADGHTFVKSFREAAPQGQAVQFSFDVPMALNGAVATTAHELNRMRQMLEDLLVRYRPGHPDVVSLSNAIDKLAASTGSSGQAYVIMTVSGEVSGRIRPNGLLDVSLQAGRSLDCGPGKAGGRGTGSLGFIARPGEEVAVEFPTASTGSCALPPGTIAPATAAPGVTTKDGEVVVTFGDFLANRPTSLVIIPRLRQ